MRVFDLDNLIATVLDGQDTGKGHVSHTLQHTYSNPHSLQSIIVFEESAPLLHPQTVLSGPRGLDLLQTVGQ